MCRDTAIFAGGRAALMPDDVKGGNSGGGGKLKRNRAPDQDVLPGILGKQLRAAYSEMLNAPIPDTITDLVKRLQTQEGGKDTTATTAEPKEREESGQ
jgi:hypothetical protein